MEENIKADPRMVEAFTQEIGLVMGAWSYLESVLCTSFQMVTEMPALMSRRIFYSGSGFDSRTRLLRAAIDSRHFDPPLLGEILIAAIKKAKDWSGTRNLIAHGDTLHITVRESIYFNQMVILEGREFFTRTTPDDRILTIRKLRNAGEHFTCFTQALLTLINWREADDLEPLQSILRLIRGFPKEVHSTQLSPTILAHFLSEEVRLPHLR